MKIAVVSCVKLQQVNPQPAWALIRAEQPDVLLLLGDNVYLDHDHLVFAADLSAELKSLYAAQLAEPNFAALLAAVRGRGGRVEAIYDDHDFLGNNRYGASEPPALALAARAELVAALQPTMTGVDVYRAFRVGPVDVVVLDERFYRRKPSESRLDADAVLGAAQWNWLDNVVAQSTAPFLLVASSTTVHRWGDESWEEYETAFDRLRALLGGRPGTLVVSGDVHRNAVYDDSGIVEIVTSGLARRGTIFGAPRENWGLLTFDAQGVRVELHSLKQTGRFDFRIELADWRLP
jgi:alkaline phosphatase D